MMMSTTMTPTQRSILLFDLSPPDDGPLDGAGLADGVLEPLVGGVDEAVGGVCVGAGVGFCGFMNV